MINIQRKTGKSVLILGVAMLAATMIFAGCVQQSNETDTEGLTPKQALLNAIEKRNDIDSYKATGTMETSVKSGVTNQSGTGSVEVYVSGEKKRVDSSITIGGQEELSRSYDLPEGQYNCQKGEDWTCETPESVSMFSGTGSMDASEIKDLIDKGAISFPQETVEQKTMMDRDCNYVKMNVDPSVLMNESTETTASIEEMQISQCFDKDTGISLSSYTEVEMVSQGITVDLKIDTVYDSLSMGADIPEGTFELPA